MDERLFPDLPEDLTALSDEDLAELLARHESVVNLITSRDEEFLVGLTQEQILEQFEGGVEQLEKIVAEQKDRETQDEGFESTLDELGARAKAQLASDADSSADDAGDDATDAEGGEGDDTESGEAAGEGDDTDTGDTAESGATAELAAVAAVDGVTASTGGATVAVASDGQRAGVAADGNGQRRARQFRGGRVPMASRERTPGNGNRAALVAAAGVDGFRPGEELDRLTYARAVETTAKRWGNVVKHDGGVEQRVLVASASFQFPSERQLHPQDWEANSEKIAAVIPDGIPGVFGLVASGGLCAPLEPIYTMPNFATRARPVRDALPSFQAERGGVNVPTATSIGDITTAISLIEEFEDALGGTYATKSCQDLTCPAYTEVPVAIIAHCREYGNLNARAWPEKIAHENDLTMAAHARTAEGWLLDRIKALSLVVTSPKVLGAYADLVDVLLRQRASMVYVLRMDPEARFRVLAPAYLADMLADDQAQSQFDRFQNQAQMRAHLESLGFTVTWYLDDVTGAANFSSEAAGVADAFPSETEIALYPEGEFIHVDSGVLELGIVRDSTLNSTNDHQLFGESFENVARLGPAQGARWIRASLCPSGEFPSTAAARC